MPRKTDAKRKTQSQLRGSPNMAGASRGRSIGFCAFVDHLRPRKRSSQLNLLAVRTFSSGDHQVMLLMMHAVGHYSGELKRLQFLEIPRRHDHRHHGATVRLRRCYFPPTAASDRHGQRHPSRPGSKLANRRRHQVCRRRDGTCRDHERRRPSRSIPLLSGLSLRCRGIQQCQHSDVREGVPQKAARDQS